jgi:hypothetical protein
MTRPTPVHIAAIAVLLSSGIAVAQECPRPNVRTTNALVTAIAQDEVMANGFETAAAACATEGIPCDEAKVRCGQLLTTTLQKQLSFDEGAYLRDMLIAYAGQQYRMMVPIASAPPLTDVSCNADAASLKQAAARRKSQAERRKVVNAEYPRWITWVNGQYKSCTDRLAVDKARVDVQSAEAAKLLAAAEAAKQAELIKQDQKAAAERAAREKAEEEAKVKAAALKAQQDAEQAQKDQIAEQKRLAEKKAEDERRAKESAEERAAREAQEAANAKIVADREGKKAAVEKQRQDLIDKENQRAENVKAGAEAKRQAAEAAHLKKVEDLKRSIELSEADKAIRLAEVDKEYEAAEAARAAEAQKAIDEAPAVDRSDERLNGALSVHATGGYFSIGPNDSVPVLGAQLTIRQGFWGTAPADGLASGVELRATALFLLSTDAKTWMIQVAPEIRYWFGFFGLGAAFDYQRIQLTTGVSTSIGLGPTLSLAAIDSPDARLIFTARWTPFLNEQYERFTGEIEGGYKVFSFAVQGGAVKQGRTTPLGVFVSASLGIRLRW